MIRPRWYTLTAGLALFLALTAGCSADREPVDEARQAPQDSSSGPIFLDVSAQVGLIDTTRSGSREKRFLVEAKGGSAAALLDYDGDGDLDIYALNGSRLDLTPAQNPRHNWLYRNDDGHFTDVSVQAGVAHRGWGMGVSTADYDNDGDPDLHVANFGPNAFYRNEGDGTFTETTAQVGVADSSWSTGSAFADYDLDGDLDLYVANYVEFDVHHRPRQEQMYMWKGIHVLRGPMGLPGAPDALYRNQGDGTFVEVTAAAGMVDSARGYGFAAVWADLDNDGDPDLVVANDSKPNYLYRNDGAGRFAEVGGPSGIAFNRDGRAQAGMGCAVDDYDGDGWQDIFLTHFSDDNNTLYHSEGARFGGALFFTDVTYPAGVGEASWSQVGWGTGFIDYDDDGDLDLFVANGHVYPEVDRYDFGTTYAQRNQILENVGGTFVHASHRLGPGLAVRKVSRGAAFGDLDGDGRVDIYVANQDDTPTLLRNHGGVGHWLEVRTVGVRSNRDGIGALVRVVAGGREQVREVRSGDSFLSCSTRRLHFGLGTADAAERVEIRWPGGGVDLHESVPANCVVTVTEGGGLELAGE
jgi:enediyne biosynthesis protein E4